MPYYRLDPILTENINWGPGEPAVTPGLERAGPIVLIVASIVATLAALLVRKLFPFLGMQ